MCCTWNVTPVTTYGTPAMTSCTRVRASLVHMPVVTSTGGGAASRIVRGCYVLSIRFDSYARCLKTYLDLGLR